MLPRSCILLLACSAAVWLGLATSPARAGPTTVAETLPAPPTGPVQLDIYLLQERHYPPAAGQRPPYVLGGANDAKAVLNLNIPLIRRAALEAQDLLEARLVMKVSQQAGDLSKMNIIFCRMLRASSDKGNTLSPGEDYEVRPVVSLPVKDCIDEKSLTRIDLAEAVRKYLAGGWPDYGLLMALAPNGGATTVAATAAGNAPSLRLVGVSSPGADFYQRTCPRLAITLRRHDNALLFDWSVRPREGVYCTARDGHLWYGNERLRLWGVCRHASHDPLQVQRVARMGFNAIRVWGPRNVHSPESAKAGRLDEALMQEYDRYVASMKRQGMFVMSPAFMYDPCGLGSQRAAVLADDSWLAGGDDWAEWKQAVAAKDAPLQFFYYFDERLERLRRRHAENFLAHVNRYTGKPYGQEEAIAIFEVWNENGFLLFPWEKGLDNWPAYFRDRLQSRWNAWLRARYKDHAALERAWGKLADGETVAGRSIRLAPLAAGMKDQPARGADLMRFLTELVMKSNGDFREYCRGLAPGGVGVSVVPFSFDTQFRDSRAWLYANSHADVNCIGIYSSQMNSGLGKPPHLYMLDCLSIAGRPTMVYETNAGHPNPYRAEWPYQVAALAAWQDWDGVFFHIFQEPLWFWKVANPDEQYLIQPLPLKYDGCDLQFECDPAMLSAMALAGQIFRSARLDKAAHKAAYRVGGRELFGPASFRGVNMVRRTFTQGAAVEFRPDLDEGLTVDGRPVGADEPLPNAAVASGKHITWDWPMSRLIIDAPTVKVYVGKPAEYTFSDGIRVGGFANDFVAFAMVSDDGRPLVGDNPTRRMKISAVRDNNNTGYQIDPAMLKRAGFVHPDERMKAISQPGRAPLVADLVPYTVTFPNKLNYRFDGYDFALRKRLSVEVKDTDTLRHDGSELFMGVLSALASGDGQTRPAALTPAASGAATSKESRPIQPSAKDRITVGAIRWDAWFDSEASRRRYQDNFLKDPKWHAWLPFFAKLVSDKEVEVFADRQEVMDQEIAYAKAGGLDYWAFLYYRPGVAADGFDHDKMNIGRRLYLSSRRRADINFCLIIYPSDGAEWKATVADAVACAREPTYQKVLAGRPLLYLLAWGQGPERWVANKDNRGSLDYLRGQFKQAALGDPYIVVQAMSPTKAATYADNLGMEAIGSYAVWGGEGYPGLARAAHALWDSSRKTGKQVVPLATAGWGGPRGGVPQQPTGPQLAEHLRDAIGWIGANPAAAPARTTLFYAWNEFDEGGHLAPTRGEGTARLDALAEVLKGR